MSYGLPAICQIFILLRGLGLGLGLGGGRGDGGGNKLGDGDGGPGKRRPVEIVPTVLMMRPAIFKLPEIAHV